MLLGIATFVNDDTIDPVSLARAIEERGFESLVIAEHTHKPAELIGSIGSHRNAPGASAGTTGCCGAIGASRYGSPCGGPLVGFALVRPQRRRPLDLRGDGKRRIDTEIRRARRHRRRPLPPHLYGA
jgi:hypothetical protein